MIFRSDRNWKILHLCLLITKLNLLPDLKVNSEARSNKLGMYKYAPKSVFAYVNRIAGVYNIVNTPLPQGSKY